MTSHIPGHNETDKRVIVIVLDGAGAGALPDAGLYGDSGSNTLRHVITKHVPLSLINLFRLGLGVVLGLHKHQESDHACSYGKMAPLSPGKDTTSGHWELAGVIMEQPFPLYPDGFPEDIIMAFEKAIGRSVLGNYAASGTEIIKFLGDNHLTTGKPIVYTSADSVFQIAAHTDLVSLEELYAWCQEARSLLTGEHAVGRVIARPFSGEKDNYRRISGRRDFSLAPPSETLLDQIKSAGLPVAVIGKVSDIFAARGITVHFPGGDNDATANDLFTLLEQVNKGLIWATFGDFDTLYGHRNNSEGFARALEIFDQHLSAVLEKMTGEDLLIITADHGCDPTFSTTDHTREYVPLLVWHENCLANNDLGIRQGYIDLAASALRWLGLDIPVIGKSFI